MTSTRSAAATTLPSRRTLIAQAGVLASIGATASMAVPVIAGDPGPIERMHAEHVRLDRILDLAIEAAEDAEERYEEPERPRWNRFAVEGGYKMELLPDNKCRCYLDDGDENIARLREMIAAKFEPDAEDQGYRNTERAERAQETLSKIETWKAEVQRRSDAAGLTDARKAEATAMAEVKEHAARVFAIEPTTFRELAYQASVLVMTWDQGEADMLPERLAEFAGIQTYYLDA